MVSNYRFVGRILTGFAYYEIVSEKKLPARNKVFAATSVGV